MRITSFDDPDRDFWIFAYGSLMWNPGFPYVEAQVGQVKDYHRSLCVLSTIYRGTPHDPGLQDALVLATEIKSKGSKLK